MRWLAAAACVGVFAGVALGLDGGVEPREAAMSSLRGVAAAAEGDAVVFAEGVADALAGFGVGWSDVGVRRVFFGVMTDAERGRVLRRARVQGLFVARARGELSGLLDRAERVGGFDDADRRAALERAIVVEAAVLPLAGARAGLVAGAIAGDADAVVSAARAAAGVRVQTAWTRAERGATLAVAGALLGDWELARRGAGAVSAEVGPGGELAGAAGEPGAAAYGLRVAAALALAAERRAEGGWSAGVSWLAERVREPGVVAEARLRFAVEDAGSFGGAGTGAGARVLDAAAEPIAGMLVEPASRRAVAWSEGEITGRVAAMVGEAGPGRTGEAVVVPWAMEAARRGDVAAGVGAIEGLVRRRGGDAGSAGAAGAVLRGGLGELGWAVLARMRLDLLAAGGEVDRAFAVRDALRFASAHGGSDETPGLLLDAAAAAWSVGGVERSLRWEAARAVIGFGVPAGRTWDEEDADYWRVRLADDVLRVAVGDGGVDLAMVDEATALADGVRTDEASRRALAVGIATALAGPLANAERAVLGGVGGAEAVEGLASRVRAAVGVAGVGAAEDAELAWLAGWMALIDGDAQEAVRLARVSVSGEGMESSRRLLAMHVGLRAGLRAGDVGFAGRVHGALGVVEGGEREAVAGLLLIAERWWGGRAGIDAGLPRLVGERGLGAGAREAAVYLVERLAERGAGFDERTLVGVTRLLELGAFGEAAGIAAGVLDRPVASAAIGRWFELVRADALFGGGDDAGAFAVYRRVAGGASPVERGARWYWHASARMLEVLAGRNADGGRTDAIAREVRRLRLQPTWGEHADCVRAIEAVARRFGIE